MKADLKPTVISEDLIKEVCQRLAKSQSLREELPGGGLLNIDRQLPFLCVYRRPAQRWDVGTERFVMGQASYLIVPESPHHLKHFSKLLHQVIGLLSREFGAFLILEIWSGLDKTAKPKGEGLGPKPTFTIYAMQEEAYSATTTALKSALARSRILKRIPAVHVLQARPVPPRARPLLTDARATELRCHTIGLEVEPVYRNLALAEEYPVMEQAIARSLGRAFQQAFFKFIRTQTSDRPKHYQALGKRSMVKAVWETDRRLAEISDAFDMLLHLNPVNAHVAWLRFKREKFEKLPVFIYPPLAVEPDLLKRKLFEIPLERIEDPVVAEIFREKRHELDRLINMLSDRGTKRFLFGSLQIFGGVEASLLKSAEDVLENIPSRSREDYAIGSLKAKEFATLAEQEIKKYRKKFPDFKGSVEIRDGISSLMVSNGVLIVGSRMRIPRKRADALIHHEVGTHMVTYFNARTQPFQLLHSGLAGYDVLQEGLAVLAEYLCGGMSRPRLRLLAARVVAVKHMIDGADFVQVFRELDRNFDFERRTAFTIALRVFRGGGLTKDADYLRGLMTLLNYLKEERFQENFFVGKFALKHMPVVRDLLWRKVLKKPPLIPRYLRQEVTQERLQALHAGVSVLDLIKRSKK